MRELSSPDDHEVIAGCRTRIDEIDSDLARLLSERFRLAIRIKEVKIIDEIPTLDEAREAVVDDNWRDAVERVHGDYAPVQRVKDFVLEVSRDLQNGLDKDSQQQ